jgi:hypothetical protein
LPRDSNRARALGTYLVADIDVPRGGENPEQGFLAVLVHIPLGKLLGVPARGGGVGHRARRAEV